MDLPDKTGQPDFEKKTNRMSKNRLKDVKSIECSNTVIRFQCSYCNSNYARKNNLDTHVKLKHKENLEDKKAKVESPYNNDNQTPVSDVQTTEFDDIESTKQFDCILCENSYSKVETLEKHVSEVHRRKSNVQLEGIFSNDQTNESKPPEAKKTKLELPLITDKKASPQEPEIFNTSSRFQCPYCASNYAQKTNLNVHLKQKHEENLKLEASSKRSANKFQCPYSANKYSQKHNMKTHVKKKLEENLFRKDGDMNLDLEHDFFCTLIYGSTH